MKDTACLNNEDDIYYGSKSCGRDRSESVSC